MPDTSTTDRVIQAYAEAEPCKDHHDRAMRCYDVQDTIAWGIALFRELCARDASLQSRAVQGKLFSQAPILHELETNYRRWAERSEKVLAEAGELERDGFEVKGSGEFRQVLEEARCLIETWDLDRELPPIEDALPLARPENPRPECYPNG